jgi:hypothetical protein
MGRGQRRARVAMNVWYPVFPLKRLPAMIRITLLGAVLAGLYGALHDQISYTISPEYFTKLKFLQFSRVDFDWPPRLFAAEVGFLGTWWVGLIAGWVVARVGLAELTESRGGHHVTTTYAIMVGTAVLVGGIGALFGVGATRFTDLVGWKEWQPLVGVEALPGFVVVSYLHWASYLGGLLGLMCAVVYVRRKIRRTRPPALLKDNRARD